MQTLKARFTLTRLGFLHETRERLAAPWSWKAVHQSFWWNQTSTSQEEVVKKSAAINMQNPSSPQMDGAPTNKGKEGGRRVSVVSSYWKELAWHHLFEEYGPRTLQITLTAWFHRARHQNCEFSFFVGFCWFIGSLEEDEAEYGDIVYVDAVGWWHHGNLSERFTELLSHHRELKGFEGPNSSELRRLTSYWCDKTCKHSHLESKTLLMHLMEEVLTLNWRWPHSPRDWPLASAFFSYCLTTLRTVKPPMVKKCSAVWWAWHHILGEILGCW